MKPLSYIIEKRLKAKEYYHVSVDNLDVLKDLPMFTYDDIEESKSLIKNFADEGRDSILYVIKPVKEFKVLTLDDTKKMIDKGLLSDIVCNPTNQELIKMAKTMEKIINVDGKKYDAIEISDYSQIDYQNDATSTLFFHPSESIESIKKMTYRP